MKSMLHYPEVIFGDTVLFISYHISLICSSRHQQYIKSNLGYLNNYYSKGKVLQIPQTMFSHMFWDFDFGILHL